MFVSFIPQLGGRATPTSPSERKALPRLWMPIYFYCCPLNNAVQGYIFHCCDWCALAFNKTSVPIRGSLLSIPVMNNTFCFNYNVLFFFKWTVYIAHFLKQLNTESLTSIEDLTRDSANRKLSNKLEPREKNCFAKRFHFILNNLNSSLKFY